MKTITSTIELEKHGSGFIPKDPYGFATKVQYAQNKKDCDNEHTILFNKGRYFETSIYNKKVLNEVSELIGSEVQYDTMIVDSWTKLEDFVTAMNCLGYYVKIEIDWI